MAAQVGTIEAGTITTIDGECSKCGANELGSFDMLHVTDDGVSVFASFDGCLLCLEGSLAEGTA